MLKDQAVDPIRQQTLSSEVEASRRRIPEAIRQAYSVVVSVNEDNDIHAFKLAVSDEPLFSIIKADRRARIQETAISSEALLPGGPYDLWRDGESSRRVKDLVGAFAQNPKLPKMLRQKEILDTVVQGVKDGIWVASLIRPDRTVKTFWHTDIDDQALKDPALEVFLPEAATLSEIDPILLSHGTLPALWGGEEITVADVTAYFAGGYSVAIPREGYEETVFVPKCEPQRVDRAVLEGIQQGFLWLTSGPASFCKRTRARRDSRCIGNFTQAPEAYRGVGLDGISYSHCMEGWQDQCPGDLHGPIGTPRCDTSVVHNKLRHRCRDSGSMDQPSQ